MRRAVVASRATVIVALLTALAACGCDEDCTDCCGDVVVDMPERGTAFPRDAWSRRASLETFHHLDDARPDGSFAFVSDDAQSDALALLAEATHVVLDEGTAARFGADSLVAPEADAVPVLLRGMFLDVDEPEPERFPPDEGLELHWSDGAVQTDFMAYSARFVQEQRRAVVALLPREPSDVYCVTSCIKIGGVRSSGR